ncbi:MAG: hypothetical protein A3G26_04815 [Betaproteobacteria bacterium RIFCSPLOWO2_12_FULL_65_110]|nr:MAG: hypothetical protein A3G26_04815 [Betaproteobacteria bacterium RIFCSPLOWO2_12_FULL_65_110]
MQQLVCERMIIARPDQIEAQRLDQLRAHVDGRYGHRVSISQLNPAITITSCSGRSKNGRNR